MFRAPHRSSDVSTWKLDDKTSRSTPLEKIARAPQAVQNPAGWGFACVRLASGDVARWGDNAHGRLATNDLEPRETPTNVEGLHVCRGSGSFDAKVPAAN